MSGTITAAGFDVHARSIDGAAVHVHDAGTVRIRFDGGVEGPIESLRLLPGPVRACYEAGQPGLGALPGRGRGRIRDARGRAGQDAQGRADRVRPIGEDAKLAPLLLARLLTPITVPSPQVEAARELVRAHDAISAVT